MNDPKIRFKGYTDAWEQRKFGELAVRESNCDISSADVPCVEYEDVIADEGQLNKDISLKEMQKKGIAFDGSQVLYGKLRPYLHNWLNPDFIGIAVGDWWVLKPVELDKNFLYRLIQTQQFDDIANQSAGSKMPRADWNLISETVFMVPSVMEEQAKIGCYFDSLDHLITLHQRKCEETKKLKKYMLQKMFPQNGESVPEIRFAGFTDAWEQRKFGELFKRRMERNAGQFDNTKWISVAKMYFQEPDKVTSNNIDTRTYVMRIGDIAFEGHPNSEFKYGRFVENDIGDGVISELFPIYQHINEYDLKYWKYAIQIERIMQSRLVRCIEISYTSSNKLDESTFLKESILVPKIAEQRKIGEYFNSLDTLITLHQRKCDELQNMKKFMLQNMFA